jgi:pyruvate/2-oxoglutarate dehydrogenase complex dihydrolipoamide acyltransferase (E2) component
MVTKIPIPLAFENMEEATIGAWLVEEGQMVREGDPLCELITEKTTFDLPSPAEGVVRLIVLPAKSVAAVGEIICLIGAPEDALPDLENDKSTFTPAAPTRSFPPKRESGKSTFTRIRATPAARRAARESGVAIEDVAAAFPDKVLSEDDVKNFTGNK